MTRAIDGAVVRRSVIQTIIAHAAKWGFAVNGPSYRLKDKLGSGSLDPPLQRLRPCSLPAQAGREQAERRYEIWQIDAAAAKVAPLRSQQPHLNLDHFIRLSALLQNPAWEPSNKAAERGGRAFRQGQHPQFRLRLLRSIGALKVRAYLKKQRFCIPPPTRLHCCQRGRRDIPSETLLQSS